MHKFGKTLVASGFCLFMAATTRAEADLSSGSLQDLMTPEQYRAAGLHKLNDEERRALYRWLRANQGRLPPAVTTALPAAVTEASVAPVSPQPAADPAPAAPLTPAGTADSATDASVVSAAAPAAGAAPAVPPASAPVSEGQPVATISRPADSAAIEKNFGLPEPREEDPEERFKLHATVKEPFKGWSGKTVFYLDNGQVWRQRVSGRYTYMGEDNRVVISKNRLGFYEMRLVDADRSVGVKRVK